MTFADPVKNSTQSRRQPNEGRTRPRPSAGGNAARYTAEEASTIKIRIRGGAKPRKVKLPDPDESVKLMDRVRKKRG